MGFFKETNAQEITTRLYQLLDEVTQQDVLHIDNAFYSALDKHAFLAQFEASQAGDAPKIAPILLERWTHYRWLRLELLYLANQRATLNKVDPSLPQVDSVNRAILEAKEAGLTLPQSLAVLEKIKLQVVSTEHPTDPLSQSSRDNLTRIANIMESDSEQAPQAIRVLLSELQQSDAIPLTQRSVEDEVLRNIKILEALYDTIPDFAQSVLAAYKAHYPESFSQYEEALWDILAKDMIKDASWAGFDADGNHNVTPQAMDKAIQLHRRFAAEKHSSVLEAHVLQECKRIELNLRQQASANLAEHNKLNAVVTFQNALHFLQQEIKTAQHSTQYLTQRYNTIVNTSSELLKLPCPKNSSTCFWHAIARIRHDLWGGTYSSGLVSICCFLGGFT